MTFNSLNYVGVVIKLIKCRHRPRYYIHYMYVRAVLIRAYVLVLFEERGLYYSSLFQTLLLILEAG